MLLMMMIVLGETLDTLKNQYQYGNDGDVGDDDDDDDDDDYDDYDYDGHDSGDDDYDDGISSSNGSDDTFSNDGSRLGKLAMNTTLGMDIDTSTISITSSITIRYTMILIA